MKYLNHSKFALICICFIFLTVLSLLIAKPIQATCYSPDQLNGCGDTGFVCTNNSTICSSVSNNETCCSTSTKLQCNWAVINNPQSPANGHYGFCVGGFTTPQEASQYSFSLRCDYNATACGPTTNASLWLTMTNLTLPSVISDGQGKYYTCFSGPNGDEFENILKEMGGDAVKNTKTACTAAGIGIVTAGVLTGGAATIGTLGGVVVKGVLTGAVCQPAMSLLGGMRPNIIGIINGPQQCESKLAVTYDFSTDTITPTTDVPGSSLTATNICNFISDSNQKTACLSCFNNPTNPGVYTPFGCIETNPQQFIGKILRIAIGIAGGIAFLMIIYGGFVIMTSAGNPEHLTNGKEIITSAISGLLLIVFSVVILKIVGVDILNIPGFGG